MSFHEVESLPYGIAIIDLDGYQSVIQNKYTTERMKLKAGDILRIKWLGTLEIICIIRQPYMNALNEAVQEVKFICKKVSST